MQAGEAEKRGVFADAPVTLVIIWVNIAIFVGEVLASRSLGSLRDMPQPISLLFGANYEPLTIALGQYDRLLASCFLHGSLLHIAMNMWSLGQIGPYAESTVGSARYAVLYVATGIAGSITSIVWGLATGHDVSSVGASGAICGVMGAALVLGVRLEGWTSSIARQIGFWLVVIVGYGAMRPGIDNAAHVGGIVAGVITATIWQRGIQYSRAATLASIGLSAFLCVAAGVTVFWRDATDPYAALAPNDRSNEVVDALRRHNCGRARALFLATDKVSPRTPDLEGLRTQVERECPAK